MESAGRPHLAAFQFPAESHSGAADRNPDRTNPAIEGADRDTWTLRICLAAVRMHWTILRSPIDGDVRFGVENPRTKAGRILRGESVNGTSPVRSK